MIERNLVVTPLPREERRVCTRSAVDAVIPAIARQGVIATKAQDFVTECAARQVIGSTGARNFFIFTLNCDFNGSRSTVYRLDGEGIDDKLTKVQRLDFWIQIVDVVGPIAHRINRPVSIQTFTRALVEIVFTVVDIGDTETATRLTWTDFFTD